VQQATQLQFDFEALCALEEPILRPEEVARILTISSRTVARIRLSGGLPYIQVGNKRFRYLKKDVLDYLKSRYRKDDWLN
jgi:excisionase family DNA binding protein